MLEELKKYCAVPAVSGREHALTELLAERIRPFADEMHADALGNLIAVKKGSAENAGRVLVCASTDEVGFFVTYIEENGYLRVFAAGGVRFDTCENIPVVSERGVAGVMARAEGAGDKHTFDVYYIDVGAKNRRDAEKKVTVGEFFTFKNPVKRLAGGRVAGSAVGARIASAVLADVMESLARVKPENDVYFAFTVQRQVGGRGAGAVARAVNPDVAVVIDATPANDVPGGKGTVALGGGVAIRLKDATHIPDAGMYEAVASAADGLGIPHVTEPVSDDAGDAAAVQSAGRGCRVAVVCVPVRYLHSPSEVCDLADARAVSALVAGIVGNANLLL